MAVMVWIAAAALAVLLAALFLKRRPLAILLDGDLRELGHWGPRPKELQTFVRTHLDRDMSKEAIHLEIRKWYVGDRGNAMLREIFELVDLHPVNG